MILMPISFIISLNDRNNNNNDADDDDSFTQYHEY